MLRGYYLSVFTAALLVAGLSGCASEPQESDPMTDASSSGAAEVRELQRKQICDDIAQQLRNLGRSQPDGLFPFPEYRNRERDSNSPSIQLYDLRNMQRRYRCGQKGR